METMVGVCVCLFTVGSYSNFSPASEEEDPLHKLMNGEIKQKIGIIPSNITYASKILCRYIV